MQYLLYILIIPFFYFNYKILISDIKKKIIPNKYLGYLLFLLPFYYFYLFLNFSDINIILFLLQIILTFIISFILYYLGIWAAGDAKYLLILSLFIPQIGIIAFIGNIALITIIYLLLYFFYFYLGKILFKKNYAKSLYKNIKIDLNEKWTIYKKNKGGNTTSLILKGLIIFLIIFVTIRLSRIYFLRDFIQNFSNGNNTGGRFGFIISYLQNNSTYVILGGIILFLGIIWIIRWSINKLKKIILLKIKGTIIKKINISENQLNIIFLVILIILLSSFIVYEFINDPSQIKKSLFIIFTYYISLFILFKILKYSYKITFGVAEINYININELKKGDIIDKEFLINTFGNQVCLGAEGIKQNKKGILYPNPSKYFKTLNKIVDNENINIINKCYKETNKYHLQNNKNFIPNNIIKVLNTFSFAPYILLGFFITYLFQNNIFKYILEFLFNFIKTLTK